MVSGTKASFQFIGRLKTIHDLGDSDGAINLQDVPPAPDPGPFHHVTQVGIMVVVKMGNENGIQFIKWKIQAVHGVQRIVAGIEQQELTIDENGGGGLGTRLRKRAACAEQHDGDLVGALQFSCRFPVLFEVAGDGAAQGCFSAVALQKEQADDKNGDDKDYAAGNEVSKPKFRTLKIE
jgi:hypothetical protein